MRTCGRCVYQGVCCTALHWLMLWHLLQVSLRLQGRAERGGPGLVRDLGKRRAPRAGRSPAHDLYGARSPSLGTVTWRAPAGTRTAEGVMALAPRTVPSTGSQR